MVDDLFSFSCFGIYIPVAIYKKTLHVLEKPPLDSQLMLITASPSYVPNFGSLVVPPTFYFLLLLFLFFLFFFSN
jgi:hypothetical protein